MRHFKHYCKLIISTIAVVLVFACHSLTSYADPLTAAMMGNQMASAFGFSGLAGLSAGSVSSLTGSFYVDLVPWNTLVTAAHAYCTVRDLLGSDNVEVELSPEISNAGYDRNVQFVQHYGANPGTIVDLGTFYRYGGYIFNRSVSISGYQWYKGPAVGTQSTAVGDQGSFSVGGCTWSYVVNRTGSTGTSYTATIGGAAPVTSTKITTNTTLCLAYSPTLDNGRIGFMEYGTSSRYGTKTLVESGITMASPVQSTIQRPADGDVINPGNKANVVTLPKSYLNGISYNSGEVIDQEALVKAILDRITEAISSGAALDSRYVDPSPAPTPAPPSSETIANTQYTVINEVFDEFKEFFGDIYDGINDFQESFGDWVDDVATGWTEVFGDIYDDLHYFQESFGDWVDDVATGWTEVFGDIYSTVSSISSTISGTISDTLTGIQSAVRSITQSIENADFDFIDAFWKNFLTPFNNFFLTIKSHLSIWHYVVEWLASISNVFTFFLGVFSGAGSQYLLPIYACFAGTVVLAVYKRFGK